MPQYEKQQGEMKMTVTSIHVLDAELAKQIGIVGPYDFVRHGLRGFTTPDRLPITFRPSLSACDALLVAAEFNMQIEFAQELSNGRPGYVKIEWAGDVIAYVTHSNTREDKLRAMCDAVMKTASHILEIPH